MQEKVTDFRKSQDTYETARTTKLRELVPIFLFNLDKFRFSLPRFLGKLKCKNNKILAKQG